MRPVTKLTIALMAVFGLWLTGIGVIQPHDARAAGGGPTITISMGGSSPYTYDPAQLNVKAGQAITITNNDPSGVHSVTAKDRSFSVDVPPQGSTTLTVPKAGSYPYHCTYHPDEHNQASITVS